MRQRGIKPGEIDDSSIFATLSAEDDIAPLSVNRRLQQGMEKVQSMSKINDAKTLFEQLTHAGQPGWEHALCAVTQDRNGNSIFAGYLPSDGNTHTHLYLAKVDKHSNIQWAKEYLSAEDEELCQVISNNQDEIFLIGTCNCLSPGNQRFTSMKIDAEGEVLFRRVYDLGYPCIAIDAVLNHTGQNCLIFGATDNLGVTDAEQHGLQIACDNGDIERITPPASITEITNTIETIAQNIDDALRKNVDPRYVNDWRFYVVGSIKPVSPEYDQQFQFNADNIHDIVNEFNALSMEVMKQATSWLAHQLIGVTELVSNVLDWLVGLAHNITEWIRSNVEMLKLVQQARVREATVKTAKAGGAKLSIQSSKKTSYISAHELLGMQLETKAVASIEKATQKAKIIVQSAKQQTNRPQKMPVAATEALSSVENNLSPKNLSH